MTNIDNVDVDGMDEFRNSHAYQYLEVLSKEDVVIVTHNTDFDLGVLRNQGITFNKSICTYKLAWKLFPKLGNHKLGTLRAMFGIPHTGEAHRASYDVEILVKVFISLADQIMEGDDIFTDDAIAKITQLSDQAKDEFVNIWPLGKHKGQRIDRAIHGDYIRWMLANNKDLEPSFKSKLTKILNS
ncbi:MAG: hypothetical protein OHK0017_08150 [Patescibacteria group bacterium]